MEGREQKELNDLFFVCSLLEHIARKTKNHRSVVVNAIGRDKLQRLYDLADVYHSENIDKLSDDLIGSHNIRTGYFDNVAMSKYSVPTIWDIGKVYKRLVADVSLRQHKQPVEALIEVYNSWISRKIEDMNSSMYYENPEYIYQSYLQGDVLC
jgi:hypothetical protein